MTRFKIIPLEERIVLDAAAAVVIYVNAKAAPGGDGSSWAHAFNNLQDALNLAASKAATGAASETIWVANGTYKPSFDTIPGNPNTATFILPNNLSLYGGFAGTETSLSQRNSARNPTLLTGDLLGNDIQNPTNSGYLASKADNAIHVVTAIGVNATIDGLTIIDGNATGTFVASQGIFNGIGGGIVDINSNLTIRNSVFAYNIANQLGGAVAQENLFSAGNLTILNTQFLNNSSGLIGGAINTGTLAAASSMSINSSTFTNNHSGLGGAFSDDSTPFQVTNSLFLQNTASFSGGALDFAGYLNDLLTANHSVAGSITNSLFISNSANADPTALVALNDWLVNTNGTPPIVGSGTSGGGGAIVNSLTANLTVRTSAFIQNSTLGDGGALLNGGAAVDVGVLLFGGSDLSVDHSLLIDNQAANGGAIASELALGSLNSVLTLQLTNSLLSANEASSRGGAVFMDSTSSQVTGNLFTSNEAASADQIWASNSFINNLSTTTDQQNLLKSLLSKNFFQNLSIQDDIHLS